VKYLLDTDTFSGLVRNSNLGLLKRVEAFALTDLSISVITRGEVLFGNALQPLKALTLQRVQHFLNCIESLPMPVEAAQHYAHIRAHLQRKGTPIGPNDLWIAAHALATGKTLVTHNMREFKRVPGLAVESWA
jgi:tRNA(fMet)-specific endonuclease VapC